MSSTPIKVGVLGAASLSSARLLPLLANHPGVELTYLGEIAYIGEPVQAVHRHLRGVLDLRFEDASSIEPALDCDVLFLTRPHGLAFDTMQAVAGKVRLVIDLSADFRLKDFQTYKQWYKATYTVSEEEIQRLAEQAVYGLPEWFGEQIANASLIANPGCYPTGIALGFGPLAAAGLLEGKPLVADCFTGISGAGRAPSPGNTFIHVDENVFAYKTGTHQHHPEIEQTLRSQGLPQPRLFFNPHVVPMEFGILSNLYIPLTSEEIAIERVHELFLERYGDAPFVRVHEPGSLPELKDVTDTNFCDIGFHQDARSGMLRVTTCLDNTMKGASSQAVQNMNLALGMAETEGLFPHAGVRG